MRAHKFKSKIFIVPGLNNSGDQHWQTIWEKQYHFTRVNQNNWDTPVREEWVETLEKTLSSHAAEEDIILVAHSLGVSTTAFWSSKYKRKIKGALLVAPSDTEAPIYPPGTTGFMPMPLNRLHFPSITITSSNDPYVSLDRAKVFTDAWGSQLIDIGNAGHINVQSGHGQWEEGLDYLIALDNR